MIKESTVILGSEPRAHKIHPARGGYETASKSKEVKLERQD